MIERKKYLERLIAKKENGRIKVITGIRRCGKSYLLFEIYGQYLRSIGVEEDHIIELALDNDENIRVDFCSLIIQSLRMLIMWYIRVVLP